MDIPTALSEANEEQDLDKELADYGVDEHGMSLDEKKSLLEVLKNSESTAREEEHSRVGLGPQNESNSTPSKQMDSGPKHNVSDEITELDCLPHKEASFQTLSNLCSIRKSDSNSDSSDIVESPKTKEFSTTTPKFTPKVSRLSLKSRLVANDDGKVNKDLLSSDDSAQCPSPPPSLSLYVTNTKAEVCNTEETLPFKTDLKLTVHKKEDRKRNIDVFNAIKDSNERPLPRIERVNVVGKTPYYVVPYGMNLKDFTVYFNEQLAKIATSLMATQRKSLDFVPWGNPVVASKSDNHNKNKFEEITGPINSEPPRPSTPAFQNTRYNFRGRSTKRKNANDIFCYKGSDEDSDDDIFPRKMSKDSKTVETKPSYSGITKQKSGLNSIADNRTENEVDLFGPTDELNDLNSNKVGPSSINNGTMDKNLSSDDETVKRGFGGRVKNICKSGIVRKREAVDDPWVPLNVVTYSITDDDEDGDDADDFEDSLENNVRNKKMRKRNTSKLQFTNKKDRVSKPNFVQRRPTGAQDKGNNEGGPKRLVPGTWLNTLNPSQEDSNVIKPSPVVNPNVRKLLRPNSASSKTNKKGAKLSSQEVDEIITPDNEEIDIHLEITDSSECPICKKMFNVNEIENHAADCGVGLTDADDVPEPQHTPTSCCPICIERFPTGLIFDSHVKSCTISKRRVQPSSGNIVPPRNRTKR